MKTKKIGYTTGVFDLLHIKGRKPLSHLKRGQKS